MSTHFWSPTAFRSHSSDQRPRSDGCQAPPPVVSRICACLLCDCLLLRPPAPLPALPRPCHHGCPSLLLLLPRRYYCDMYSNATKVTDAQWAAFRSLLQTATEFGVSSYPNVWQRYDASRHTLDVSQSVRQIDAQLKSFAKVSVHQLRRGQSGKRFVLNELGFGGCQDWGCDGTTTPDIYELSGNAYNGQGSYESYASPPVMQDPFKHMWTKAFRMEWCATLTPLLRCVCLDAGLPFCASFGSTAVRAAVQQPVCMPGFWLWRLADVRQQKHSVGLQIFPHSVCLPCLLVYSLRCWFVLPPRRYRQHLAWFKRDTRSLQMRNYSPDAAYIW